MAYVVAGHFTLDATAPAQTACGREADDQPEPLADADAVDCGGCRRTRAFKLRPITVLEDAQGELEAAPSSSNPERYPVVAGKMQSQPSRVGPRFRRVGGKLEPI